ncbi:hypothetical protein ACOMCU_10530 [Lysinibacillus sp. UGB7]|uniref:hypothetical protein n=1 Tax=Lysinibacillus sp. UGB7 TaxID=3411039 RepID=UPI003B7855DF
MNKLTKIIYSIFNWVKNYFINMLNNNKLTELYFIFGMSFAVVTIFLGVKLHLIFRVILFAIFVGPLFYMYYYIKNKGEFIQADKYRYLAILGIALLYSLVISRFLLSEYSKLISWMMLIILFFIFYYSLKAFVFKYINHWFKYSLLFLLSPIIVAFFWSFCGMHLMEVTKKYLFISNDFLGWVTLILSIIVMNLIIYTSPDNNISELKVAIYFSLAIFSTISYSFFLSDISTSLVIDMFKISEEKELVKQTIDTLLKWMSLPYLIGMVFGCFTIELKQRNLELKVKGN